jgi:predicted metal-dependent hydrolase
MNNDRRDRLRQRVERWSQRLKVQPRVIRIQHMTRKWGSCSINGTISLASDLDDQTAEFQDFVIAHELLHLKVQNHGRLFRALMTIHVPQWREHEFSRRIGSVSCHTTEKRAGRKQVVPGCAI